MISTTNAVQLDQISQAALVAFCQKVALLFALQSLAHFCKLCKEVQRILLTVQRRRGRSLQRAALDTNATNR